MLHLTDVEAGYAKIQVLWAVSLEVSEGEIVCLLGPNGAGKSTTLKVITGLLRPLKGDVAFRGTSIVGLPPHRIARMGISMVPEGRELFPHMPVKENILMGLESAANTKDGSDAIERVCNLFPILKDRMDQRAATLSGGEQQMLAIARALVSKPSLLIFDEPSAGLAPKIVVQIFKTLRKLREEGLTLLLVEQNAKMALEVADRGYLIEAGRITLDGSADELRADPKVRTSYLGSQA